MATFGGLSVDAGIIGVIPVSLCDPQALKDTVPSDARLINNFATLERESWGDIIIVDGEAINGHQCECNYCSRSGGGQWYSEDNMVDCDSCGAMVSPDCVEYGDERRILFRLVQRRTRTRRGLIGPNI